MLLLYCIVSFICLFLGVLTAFIMFLVQFTAYHIEKRL